LVSGEFDAAVSNDNSTPSDTSDDFSVFTDNDVNFGDTLTAGTTYTLEIVDASDTSLNGVIQEVTVWNGNTITTPQDIFADGLAVGDKYQIRAASTISDLFGPTNTVGLLGAASSTSADRLLVPNASGTFDVYYYSTGGFFGVGWRKVGEGSSDFANQAIFLSDGFYIFRQPTQPDLDLVITGTVKVSEIDIAITSQFTFVSGIFPVGSTLDSSQMQNSLTGGASSTAADSLLVQNEGGSFDTYFYSTGGFFGIGWRRVGAGNTDFSDFEIPSAFVVRRVGDDNFNLEVSIPVGYENL